MSYTRHNPLGYDVRMELFGSRDSVVVGWDDRAPLRSLESRSGRHSQRSPIRTSTTASPTPTPPRLTPFSMSPEAGSPR